MNIKVFAKALVGKVCAQCFQVRAGEDVYIGKHCVIGANSVVTKDVPDYCVAVGNSAKVIKKM